MYKNGDTIYVPQRIGKTVKLTIHRENATVDPASTTWKQDGTTKCTAALECNFGVSQTGTFITRFDFISTTLITNPVKVYQLPTMVFMRDDAYNGQYGFDNYDSTFRKPNIQSASAYSAGYEIININGDPNYKVPWMSVLDQQTASIKDTLFNLSNDAIKDVGAFVELRSTNTNITFNGMSSVQFPYSNLNVAYNLPIAALQWDGAQTDALKAIESIYAITNTGDTIGKLHISCYRPQLRKVVYVYVNTGTGYDSSVLTKVGMLEKLNTYSHNQILRNWTLNNSYSDTLDVSTEYSLHQGWFIRDSLPNIFRNLYNQHKNIDVVSINSGATISNKIHFFFISNLVINISGGQVVGRTFTGGEYGTLLSGAGLTTCAHEHGHILNLPHTKDPPLSITEYTTPNIMDYWLTTDLRNAFFLQSMDRCLLTLI